MSRNTGLGGADASERAAVAGIVEEARRGLDLCPADAELLNKARDGIGRPAAHPRSSRGPQAEPRLGENGELLTE